MQYSIDMRGDAASDTFNASSGWLPFLTPTQQKMALESLQKSQSVNDVIEGKYNFYTKGISFPTDPDDLSKLLQKISENISADMIREGNPISVSDVKMRLFTKTAFHTIWANAKDAVKDVFTIPTWLKWSLIGGGTLAVLVVLRPYIMLATKFKRQAR